MFTYLMLHDDHHWQIWHQQSCG